MAKLIRQENVFIIEQSKFSEEQLKFLFDELKQKFEVSNESYKVNLSEVKAFREEMRISEGCSDFNVNLFMEFLKENGIFDKYKENRSVMVACHCDMIRMSRDLLSRAFEWDDSMHWTRLDREWRKLLKSLE